MKSIIFIVILAVFATSCRAFVIADPPEKLQPPITYSCDDSLAAPVAQAFALWDLACGGGLFQATRVSGDAQVTITGVSTMPAYLAAYNYIGYTTWTGTSAMVDVLTPDPSCLNATILHELGHALGLMHSTDSSAIMWPIIAGPVQLSQDDIDGIRFIYLPSTPLPRFSAVVKKHRVKFSPTAAYPGLVVWDFGDGSAQPITAKPVFHTYRKGAWAVTMRWQGLIISQVVTIN